MCLVNVPSLVVIVLDLAVIELDLAVFVSTVVM
jgi:hypothetical protein